MASGCGEPTRRPSRSSSFPSSSDICNFECNICFDLAQDPILTLCGHLFCWPCLYKWLHIHSRSRECPVCKALVEEEKLVPLYGRGKNSTDPRSKSLLGSEIPSRPAGQRPETAPQQDPNPYPQNGLGLMGGMEGLASMRSTIFGSLRSSEFGGLFHPLFNAQMHRNPAAALYGVNSDLHYGHSRAFPRGHLYAFPRPISLQQQVDFAWKLLVFVLAFAIVALFFT